MSTDRTIYLGKSRRKVIEVQFVMLPAERISEGHYKIYVAIKGFPDEFNRSLTPGILVHEREKSEDNPAYPHIDKTIETFSEFDALVSAMAYFRQNLRFYLEQNPGIKIYEKVEGNLQMLEIDDIFWTHDCVPEET